MIKLLLCLIVLVISLEKSVYAQSQSQSDMKTFLTSCGYGTVAGAGIGLVSLAFSEDPSSKMNNIARGASYGLYAGIGIGLYLINAKSSDNYSEKLDKPKDSTEMTWFAAPKLNDGKIEGAQFLVNLGSF